MGFRAERYGTRADTAAFFFFLILSLTALALPEALRVPVSGFLRQTVLSPLLGLERGAVQSAENRARAEQVRLQRDSLALAASVLPQVEAENARLRGLLSLGARLGTGFVTGEVLHQAGVTDGLTLVLSVGASSGVEAMSPVIAPEGLVGIIRSVDPKTSVALAWTHPDFRVSAMVGGEQVFGIVAARRGERSGEMMELRGVAYRLQLPPGTAVVTSGLGGVWPRGVPIGTVQGMLSENAGWERTYLLRPAVHPAQATHVMVLHPQRASENLAPAFATPDSTADSAAARRRAALPRRQP